MIIILRLLILEAHDEILAVIGGVVRSAFSSTSSMSPRLSASFL